LLTQEQLAGLREKAEDVSKLFSGVWNLQPIDHKKNVLRMSVAKHEGIPWYKTGEACADFCTACNPSTILKLLDMIERMEKEADWLADNLTANCNNREECYTFCPSSLKRWGCHAVTVSDWREAARKAVKAFLNEKDDNHA